MCAGWSSLVASNSGFKLGDALVRYRESVFQADDALRGVQGQALIEQCSQSGGEFELAARVAAMSAAGAVRLENARGIEAAQERRLYL